MSIDWRTEAAPEFGGAECLVTEIAGCRTVVFWCGVDVMNGEQCGYYEVILDGSVVGCTGISKLTPVDLQWATRMVARNAPGLVDRRIESTRREGWQVKGYIFTIRDEAASCIKDLGIDVEAKPVIVYDIWTPERVAAVVEACKRELGEMV